MKIGYGYMFYDYFYENSFLKLFFFNFIIFRKYSKNTFRNLKQLNFIFCFAGKRIIIDLVAFHIVFNLTDATC